MHGNSQSDTPYPVIAGIGNYICGMQEANRSGTAAFRPTTCPARTGAADGDAASLQEFHSKGRNNHAYVVFDQRN
jgi:hypothetical protein